MSVEGEWEVTNTFLVDMGSALVDCWGPPLLDKSSWMLAVGGGKMGGGTRSRSA